MKEYIKYFNDLQSADEYKIVDIPFISSIATDPIQNLYCDEENKKIVVSGDTVSIVDAGPELISFNILCFQHNRTGRYPDGDISCQCSSGMTWREFIHSEYNTDNLVYDTWDGDEIGYPSVDDWQGYFANVCDSNWQDVSLDDIILATDYQFELGLGSLPPLPL